MTAICPERKGQGHWWRIPQPPKPQIGECLECHETQCFKPVMEERYGYFNREFGWRKPRHDIDLEIPGWRDGDGPQNLGECARAWRP